jgi:hypothetical protein
VAQPTYWDDLGVWRRISDYGEWNSGDTIAAGECRFDPSTMRDYYCTTGLSETDNTRPPSALVKSQNPSEASLWYDMGPANAFRVYDREIISTMGSDEQSMWTLFKTTGGQLTDTIGVFGMRSIQTIRVRAWSLAQNAFVDTPIFDETRDVRYNELDYIGKSAATFRLSSPMYGAQIRVDATRFAFYTPSLTSRIAIGVVEAGLAIDMGSTITEFETTSADFSTKTTDEFGVVRIVQRGYARQVTCDVVIKTANLDGWKRRLDSYRATPCMYNLNNSGTSYESLILFGLYETARFKSQGLSESILSLSIKELTTS